MSDAAISTIDQVMQHGLDTEVIHKHTEDLELSGRTVTIDGASMVNFGSCSYLGLEHHPDLVEGAIDAVRRYGTQFSTSRTYASLGMLEQLESEMTGLFGQPVIVTPSTTMGHLATLPVIVSDEDAVIMDMQVHASVQMASQQLKARNIPISVIRHNHMEALERRIRSLRVKHRRIWFLADGVYSMYGDFAPLERLQSLLEVYPELHLYIDDAHGMGWAGPHGIGYVRSQMPHHPRMILATSMNKSFAAAGGCMVFPNQSLRDRVLKCGGTLIFSGPIQPPMLGVALASARLHRGDELEARQARVAQLTAHMNRRLRQAGLPQFLETDSPLFFVPLGLPKLITELIARVKADGYWINSAGFPATPMKRGGLRFMVNAHLTEEDIDGLVEVIARHYPAVLQSFGLTCEDVAKTFGIPPFEVRHVPPRLGLVPEPEALECRHLRTIHHLGPQDWDRRHARMGTLAHHALAAVESVFATDDLPTADRWNFHYFEVRDRDARVVLSTFFTAGRLKDDMFAPAAVSARIEKERLRDPEHLTSLVVMTGCMVTKGEHLWLDRSHPDWRQALARLVEAMQEVAASVGANQIMLREMYGDLDEGLRLELLELGLTAIRLPDNVMLREMHWEEDSGYLARLGRRYRSDFRREILRHEPVFRVETRRPSTEAELRECYQLYLNVHERAFEMNVHRLPYGFFRTMAFAEGFDVLRLYMADDPRPEAERAPVAVLFGFVGPETYHAMFVGLDYDVDPSSSAYKQILYQCVRRAHALGATDLDLAFTAELVKKKVGARPEACWAFVQIDDAYNLQVIDAMTPQPRAV